MGLLEQRIKEVSRKPVAAVVSSQQSVPLLTPQPIDPIPIFRQHFAQQSAKFDEIKQALEDKVRELEANLEFQAIGSKGEVHDTLSQSTKDFESRQSQHLVKMWQQLDEREKTLSRKEQELERRVSAQSQDLEIRITQLVKQSQDRFQVLSDEITQKLVQQQSLTAPKTSVIPEWLTNMGKSTPSTPTDQTIQRLVEAFQRGMQDLTEVNRDLLSALSTKPNTKPRVATVERDKKGFITSIKLSEA